MDGCRTLAVRIDDKVVVWGDTSRSGKKRAHVGSIIEMCVEKNSELLEGHRLQTYEGGVVLQGNQVWDANYDCAIFR